MPKTGEEIIDNKTHEQKLENVHRRLARAIEVIEEDISSTPHLMVKRIEADAAVIATLNIVDELLPAHVQEQVERVIVLHDAVWGIDTPLPEGSTPRKPLAEGLQRWVHWITSIAQK